MKPVQVGNKYIGENQPVFIVAEMGINHNGDINLAKKMIDAAIKSGADAVKFQNYKTEDFISDRDLTFEYTTQGRQVIESQYEMFKRYELDDNTLETLKKYCDKKNIIFQSAPTGFAGVDALLKIGTRLLKNGSDFLTNIPLIKKMGDTGLPTVISTGMATETEIEEAVHAFRNTGNEEIVLLHCTSCYPTNPEDVNLRKITSLISRFKCNTGFSDHTIGTEAAMGAVALGACLVEKHFTLEHDLPGPDHHFSADPVEFETLVKAVRLAEKMLGQSSLGPVERELKSRQDFRLSCVANSDLSKGHILKETDITGKRPGTGIPVSQGHLLIGRKLKKAIDSGQLFNLQDFE